MNIPGFTQNDFSTFTIGGLAERMVAIRERIQPKFRAIGEPLTQELSMKLGNEMFLHIAQHARRTVNPPKDTWLAISPNKRGYKKHPHFQLGLFDDRLFIWLAFIYELPFKQKIATTFLNNINKVQMIIPPDYVISMDHTQKQQMRVAEIDLAHTLERFRNVKKAEFLIGRHIAASDPIITNGTALYALTRRTFETLIPLYLLAYSG